MNCLYCFQYGSKFYCEYIWFERGTSKKVIVECCLPLLQNHCCWCATGAIILDSLPARQQFVSLK